MYLKTWPKARLFEQLKAQFIAKNTFRKYSSQSCWFNPAGVARLIILRLFPVLVPCCNSVRRCIPSGLPALPSYALIVLDFRQAEDLLWSCIELVPVSFGWARTLLHIMHITRVVPIAVPKWSPHCWKYFHTSVPRRSEFHRILFLPVYFAV